MSMNKPGCPLPILLQLELLRGLLQLVDLPTRSHAILDLILFGHQGSIQSFPAFNTSDHLVLLVTVSISNSDFVSSPS